jgi:methylated-DNA-[protein]-cysteine S-methyltransferase
LTGYALFDTAIGSCAIAWGPQGIVGLRLPDENGDTTRRRLRRRFADAQELAPPPAVQHAIDDIVALLRGEPRDLLDVALDMHEVPEFQRRVYELARRIAPGRTLTYGEVAEQLGEPGAARAVGQALGRNPFPIVVPCHRVLAAHGQAGGFSAPGGLHTKLKLLTIEKARLGAEPGLFDD